MTLAPVVAERPGEKAWHRQTAEEVLGRLGSSAIGLTAQEAAHRLAADGPNQLTEAKHFSALQILLGQFKSLIIWILIAAGVVSGLLGERVDAIAILAIVVLNAVIGFYQEFKAEKSIAALKKMTAAQAKVRRDGSVTSIPASKIVTGDILQLEAGDLVAADARLLESSSLRCIEAPLTGESEAVAKQPEALERGEVPLADRENMVFMATSVAAGTGQAVVVATAMKTELGRIAGLIEEAGTEDKTPLQQKLTSFGHILIWVALGIVALLFGLGLLRGMPLLELFMTSVSLAVAAVPEGLPAVVTVALSLGVLRMARRRALVRKLAAVETLGSTSVICTDKTGTLTVGEMTVRALSVAGERYEITGEGYGPDGEVRFEGKKAVGRHLAPLRELATVLLGCNNAHLVQEGGTWKTVGDPTEGALLVAGAKAGVDRQSLEKELPKHHEIPFDSDRKRSTVLRTLPDGKLRAFVNGAPDVLLERCTSLYTSAGDRPMTDDDRRSILAHNSAMAEQALRVLGSARRDLNNASPDDLTADAVERDLVFVGLSGMYDPPRQEAKEAVERCRAAGIRVVMITGDHPKTAMAIAREIGLASGVDKAIAGVELEKMSDEELRRRAPEVAVYARVTAEHKLRIIRALKANDAVVAMTGDGVNDAPAIKGADIGIAMGKAGTEVTKQAADMIITDDNFATIVAAVEEGRGIYDNIRKTLQYLLAGNTGELLLMTACVVIGLPTPLLPIHLLWINLVTDGLPALCLAIDPIDPDVMRRLPRRRSERIANRGFLWMMFFTGLLTAGVAFAVYLFILKNGSPEVARTYAFAVLVFAELLRSFGARSETKPVWRISLLTNISLVVVVGISFGLQVWSQHNATIGRFLKTSFMPLTDCLVLLAVGAIPLLALELVKMVRNARRQGKTEKGRGAGSPDAGGMNGRIPTMKDHKHSEKGEPEMKPGQDEVAKKAYAIYEKEGRPQGHAEQNWSEAEVQLQHAGSDHPEHMENMKNMDHKDHHAHMAADFRKRFWISLVLTLPILALSPLLQKLVGLRETIHFPGDLYVLFGFASAVYWYGGWPFLKGLFNELKSRQPGMMTLVAVAITTAYAYSSAVVFGLAGKMFFWELATLVDIMLLGHWIEMKSVMGASKALEELAKLMPSDAHKLMPDGNVKDVPLGELAVDDKVLIKPGEKIPADGVIVKGESSVNEAMLTGESTPVNKKSGGKVIGGAINGEGSLTIEVKGTGKDSFLSQVIDLVKQAQESKSKTQDLANTAAMWLTIIALGSGALTLVIWLVLVGKEFAFAIERAVTVMVITCPHALGLAVPLVVAVTTALAAKNGLLIRNRGAFEGARKLQAIIFDKTGTLTEGRFGVTDTLVLSQDIDEETLRAYAAAVDANSEHPIAKAIAASSERKLPVENFKGIPGKGAEGRVNGKEVKVVSPGFLREQNIDVADKRVEPLQAQGKTVVFVLVDGKLQGAIALADIVRPEAKQAIDALKALKIRCMMLTGDNKATAKWVSDQVGLDEYFAEVLPKDKAAKVKEVQARGVMVAMTGDGVNDAPALAQADVGIAIGAGSDVAVETADVVLVRSNPLDVVAIVQLSRATYRKMIQNLVWATGYNVIAIPLAAGALFAWGVVLTPAVGAALMSASTVIVAINARLLRLKK